MKKMKLIKAMFLLFIATSFTNCEEDGPIQFIVVDDFETNATVTGIEGKSTFVVNENTDVSSLLDNASTFVNANIESVIITLNNYNGNSIEGNYNLTIGGKTIFNQSLKLEEGKSTDEISIPPTSSDILTSINSGNVKFDFLGNTTAPLADNDFSLNFKLKIRATVE